MSQTIKCVAKKIIALNLAICCFVSANAQTNELTFPEPEIITFRHLDLAVNVGSTGIGIDVSSPISDYVGLRAGFSFMPRLHYKMNFGVQVGEDEATSDAKFEKLSGLLTQMTGRAVDNSIDMIGRPTYSNFKLLCDVYPFRDKRWHLTAGFYWGKSEIADAYNTTEDMQSLMAVSIYNNFYDMYLNDIPLYEDVYFPPPVIGEKMLSYGRMGIHIGDYTQDMYDESGALIHKAGDPYMMEPNEESMAKAKVEVNSFKPYLGFGYGGALLKNNDNYTISFDCGLLFWGGTPSIITHDGTDLAKDVENVRGKVGRYVDIVKGFKVFPVVELRIARKLF